MDGNGFTMRGNLRMWDLYWIALVGLYYTRGIGKLAGFEGFCFRVGRLETVVEPKPKKERV